MNLITLLSNMHHLQFFRGTSIHNFARAIAGMEPIDIIIDMSNKYGTAAIKPEALGGTVWIKT